MKDKEITYKDHVPRDVSWMFFNRRILQEAMKPHVPLLERLGFLGIYSNNLDDFFVSESLSLTALLNAMIRRRVKSVAKPSKPSRL